MTDPARRRTLTWELWVVLLLAVIPHLVNALMAWGTAEQWEGSFVNGWISHGMHSVQIAAVVLFLMWRSGDPWRFFGIVRVRWALDVSLGLLVFMTVWASYSTMYYMWFYLMYYLGMGWSTPTGGAESVPVLEETGAASVIGISVFVIAMALNAFAEEVAMRGYLIPRLRQLGAGMMGALVITSLLFGGYHLYQGGFAACSIVLGGLIIGGVFLLTGRLWPCVVAHLALDLLAGVQYL